MPGRKKIGGKERLSVKVHPFLWAALLILAVCPSHAQTVLTLDEAVALAAHNRGMQRAALEPDKAGDQIAAARTQRLPQFNFTAFAGELLNHPAITFEMGILGNSASSGPVPANRVRLSAPERPLLIPFAQASLPLSQQYRIGLGIKKLQLERQMEQEEARDVRADVIAKVKESYYKLVLSTFDLETARNSVRVYREVERTTQHYVAEQTALPAELLDVQARRARAEYDLTVVRDRQIEEMETLNLLLGRPIDTQFKVAPIEDVGSYPADLSVLREKALASSPAVRQARLRVQQSRIAERLKKAEYIPDVSLSGNYVSAAGLPSIFPQNFAAAGLLFAWKPLDWGRKRHETDELTLTEKDALLSLQDEEDRVRIRVGVQVRKLAEARQLLAAARINQKHAQEEVRVMQVRYSQNAALMKGILESQATAAAAHAQTQKALTEWWDAMAGLEKLLGDE